MSDHSVIVGINARQRAQNIERFKQQPMWFLSSDKKAFFELERLCGIINAVRRMDYRTPFFIGGGSLFRAAVGSEALGDFDLWIKDGEEAREQAISTVVLAFEREFPGETPQVVRKEKGPTRITCHHFVVEVCQVFGVPEINALGILSQFDLYASMWGTDGETVIFHRGALTPIETGAFYTHQSGANTASRIEKYRSIYQKATGLEPPPQYMSGGLELNPNVVQDSIQIGDQNIPTAAAIDVTKIRSTAVAPPLQPPSE